MSENSRSALMSVPPRRAETMGISVIVILAAGACGYWLLHTASNQFSRTIRNTRAKAISTKSVDTLAKPIRQTAKESDLLKTLDRWRREAEVAKRNLDFPALVAISERMSGLMLQLGDLSDIRIDRDANRQSGLIRDVDDESGNRPATSE